MTTTEHATTDQVPAYTRRVVVQASTQRVFETVATLDGLRGWWTPRVSGSAEAGHDIRFEFNGVDEHIVMHVDEATPPSTLRWTCATHSRLPDWNGTRPTFEILELGEQSCELRFCHIGLAPILECYTSCERGWDHFLASLVAVAEHGEGTPFTA